MSGTEWTKDKAMREAVAHRAGDASQAGWMSDDALSRRTFLHSLGALAVLACGETFGGASAAFAAVSKGSTAAFVHPGLLHTQADFDRVAQKVMTHAQPWFDGWSVLIANGHANSSWKPRPQIEIDRGGKGPQNYGILYNDVAAAYACALRWKVTGDRLYADTAVRIMNEWAATLQRLGGDSNVDLAAGLYGYEFANAGEIMRGYPNWAAADFAAFQKMMRTVFYPINTDFLHRHNNTDITHYWANWDLCNIASILAIGVLCDDRALFDEAIDYFRSGPGNGAIPQAVYYLHPGHLGQWQESGRDQGHNTLGIALAGAICEMAWNQGVDLYGYDNNRFLAGAEYVAKANLRQAPDGPFFDVPYVTYANANVTQTQFATGGQGGVRPCWALVYNHYVNRKGLAAPWSKRFALAVQPEGGGGNYGPNSGGYDQLGYGTLMHTRDPAGPAPAPSGLTAHASAGRAVLSWWGVANGTHYTVKRGAASGGPYATVATGIVDSLTWTDSPAAGTWYYVVSATTPTGDTANSAEARVVTGQQLQIWLPFDESRGTTAADRSGNGHAGTLVGAATFAPGRNGNALSLDGAGSYVALPAGVLADVSDFTVAAWVCARTVRKWSRVFDFGAGTGRYMMLTPLADTGALRFAITVNGSHGERRVDTKAPLRAGQWTHVAVTLAGTTATLYVDGAAVGSTTDAFLAPWRLGPTANNWIGRSQFAADPAFDGLVSDFRMYQGALTATQVAALAR